MTGWLVTVERNDEIKHLNTVFFVDSMRCDEVKESLINHDGFPSDIWIYREKDTYF